MSQLHDHALAMRHMYMHASYHIPALQNKYLLDLRIVVINGICPIKLTLHIIQTARHITCGPYL